MSRKKIALRIIAGLIVITTLSAVVAYFSLQSKPWTALLAACCGGLLDINFLTVYFLVRKNFKD